MKKLKLWLKNRFYNLPARIVRVFVVQAILTMLLLAIVGFYVVNKNNQERVPLLLEDYLQRLAAEFPAEPDNDYFEKLHQETGLKFGYQQDDRWPILIADDHDKFKSQCHSQDNWKAFRNHPDWLWDFKRGHLLVSMPKYQGTLWIHFGFGEDEDHRVVFWFSVSIIGFMLFLTYLWVRCLLVPIREIEAGAKHYSDGEFSYRLPIKGQDDMAELSSTVNRMAEQIENRLQKNHELFVAMSHELRTPLARLRVALEMLADSDNKELMQRSQQDMEQLIDALLLREQLQFQDKSLLQKVDAIAIKEWIAKDIDDADSYIQVSIAKNFRLDLDGFALRLLLKNLLNNACKYGEGKPVKLSVVEHDKQWLFAVEDQGIGIEQEQIGQIFEPFYRVDKARSRQTGGHGLGLYLAQMLARQLGSKIQVESEPERGSKFYFSISKQS